jgi:uncharacterized OB-fold protein
LKENAMASSAQPLSAAYVEGLDRGEVRYQACVQCGAAQTLPRYACRRCGSVRLEWRTSKGRGTVHAVTVVMRAPSEDFRPLAPYTLVLVDLDEKARVMAHAEPGATIGDRVVAAFFKHGDRTLVRFRPDSKESS